VLLLPLLMVSNFMPSCDAVLYLKSVYWCSKYLVILSNEHFCLVDSSRVLSYEHADTSTASTLRHSNINSLKKLATLSSALRIFTTFPCRLAN
jgi:hypothetical protein